MPGLALTLLIQFPETEEQKKNDQTQNHDDVSLVGIGAGKIEESVIGGHGLTEISERNKERRQKHWVYIWCFKAICQEGLLDNVTKNQLKKVIGEYRQSQSTSITDFEMRIIDQVLL